MFKSQLMRLSKKYNESIQKQKKQEEMIEKIRTEKMQLKKELINTNYERKNFESQLANQIDEVKKLKSELKAKGNMIVTLENSRRKLEVELSKSGHRSDPCPRMSKSGHQSVPCPRMSRSRNSSGNSQNSGLFRQRSFSVDRLHEQNKSLGRQLLKSGQSSAYTLSKKGTKKVVSKVTSEPEADFEKVILLQKLLLQKTKILAEKEVRIEELERTNSELSLIVSRLKATRHLAQELTDTRHKLALKSNQLEVSFVFVTILA